MLVIVIAQVGRDHALVHAGQDVAGEQRHLVQRPADGELPLLEPERRQRAEQQDDRGGRADDDPGADVPPQVLDLGRRHRLGPGSASRPAGDTPRRPGRRRRRSAPRASTSVTKTIAAVIGMRPNDPGPGRPAPRTPRSSTLGGHSTRARPHVPIRQRTHRAAATRGKDSSPPRRHPPCDVPARSPIAGLPSRPDWPGCRPDVSLLEPTFP